MEFVTDIRSLSAMLPTVAWCAGEVLDVDGRISLSWDSATGSVPVLNDVRGDSWSELYMICRLDCGILDVHRDKDRINGMVRQAARGLTYPDVWFDAVVLLCNELSVNASNINRQLPERKWSSYASSVDVSCVEVSVDRVTAFRLAMLMARGPVMVLYRHRTHGVDASCLLAVNAGDGLLMDAMTQGWDIGGHTGLLDFINMVGKYRTRCNGVFFPEQVLSAYGKLQERGYGEDVGRRCYDINSLWYTGDDKMIRQ